MSIWKNGKLVAGGSQALPLLCFMWSDHQLNHPSWLNSTTFSWQSGAVYQAVYAHLTADITGKTLQSETISGTTIQFYLADDGHKICPASEESNVTAIYNATGVAWYYILDTVNQRFKLPRTKFGFTGIRSGVGGYVEAGLPNITGNITSGLSNNVSGMQSFDANGAFQVTATAWTQYFERWGDRTGASTINLNASRSSSIYGNSDTVQPKATEMYLYFYVGQFTQTALENTAGLNAELFNGKVDTGHQVIAFQEPTSANNYTWYRLYADGWVEQGGKTTTFTNTANGTSDNKTVVLPITMLDANYNTITTRAGGSSGWSWRELCVSGKTTTQFTIEEWTNNAVSGTTCYAEWQVSGMAAQ